MGIDISQRIEIGLIVSEENLVKPFLQIIPEVAHFENRFDTTTGKKLDPIKVVDIRERRYFVFNSIRFDEARELADAIAKHSGCGVSQHEDWCSGAWNNHVFGFGLQTHGDSDVRCLQPDTIPLEAAVAEYSKLLDLREKLHALEIREISSPQISNSISIS